MYSVLRTRPLNPGKKNCGVPYSRRSAVERVKGILVLLQLNVYAPEFTKVAVNQELLKPLASENGVWSTPYVKINTSQTTLICAPDVSAPSEVYSQTITGLSVALYNILFHTSVVLSDGCGVKL